MGPNTDLFKKIHPKLPIFRVDKPAYSILYSNGQFAIVGHRDADMIEHTWQSGGGMDRTTLAGQAAEWICTQARKGVQNYRQWQRAAFVPECLTIYLSNACNMDCSYCYAAKDRPVGKNIFPTVNAGTAAAAAETVAKACVDKGRPFQLVLHGGGEPTLHWQLLQTIVRQTQIIAARRQIEWRAHIATNGILTGDQTRWLGENFTSVGLSCDGPPDIQDRQRPLASGQKSSHLVARTAKQLCAGGAFLTARATITPATAARQVEIVTYLGQQLGIRQIRFEPAYRLDSTSGKLLTEVQADAFVDHFIRAQEKARQLGCELRYAGVRPDEIHGPYCNVLRNVLHLLPGGMASSCFFCTDIPSHAGVFTAVGNLDPAGEAFLLDTAQIATYRRKATVPPDVCLDCVNLWHCTYGCPDRCLTLKPDSGERPTADRPHHPAGADFRCRVNQRLTWEWVSASAEQMAIADGDSTRKKSTKSAHEKNDLRKHLHHAPTWIDTAEICQQYDAVSEFYDLRARKMPDPLWAQRGYDHVGEETWYRLKGYRFQSVPPPPMAIYLHVPFCDGHCGFCDCLSIGLKQRHRSLEQSYVDAVGQELKCWARLPDLSKRRVSTIHWGGGTPAFLSSDLMEKLATDLRKHTHVGPQTEWALESTVRLISKADLIRLKAMGFSRLHVGVQTLDEQHRLKLGRKMGRGQVLKRLELAMQMGFVTSVDLIYGFPGQDLCGLLASLSPLIEMGIHGVSLYRLNRSRRNARYLNEFNKHKPDALVDWAMLQVADQLLLREGYKKNHFCHYALPVDRNLYANHARRGEDLLALGPTADGCMGPYLYRHPNYAKYINSVRTGGPGLEGGLQKTTREIIGTPLSSALLSSQIDQLVFTSVHAEHILNRWREIGLIKPTEQAKAWTLSANGSWFVNEMIAEIMECISLETSN